VDWRLEVGVILWVLGSGVFFVIALIWGVVMLGQALRKQDVASGAWSFKDRVFAILFATFCLEFVFVAFVSVFCFSSLLEIAKDPNARIGMLIGVLVTAAVFNFAPSPLLVLILVKWRSGQ